MRIYFKNRSQGKSYRIALNASNDTSKIEGGSNNANLQIVGGHAAYLCIGPRPSGWGYDFGINYGAPSK